MRKSALIISILLLIVTIISTVYELYHGGRMSVENVALPVVLLFISIIYYRNGKK